MSVQFGLDPAQTEGAEYLPADDTMPITFGQNGGSPMEDDQDKIALNQDKPRKHEQKLGGGRGGHRLCSDAQIEAAWQVYAKQVQEGMRREEALKQILAENLQNKYQLASVRVLMWKKDIEHGLRPTKRKRHGSTSQYPSAVDAQGDTADGASGGAASVPVEGPKYKRGRTKNCTDDKLTEAYDYISSLVSTGMTREDALTRALSEKLDNKYARSSLRVMLWKRDKACGNIEPRNRNTGLSGKVGLGPRHQATISEFSEPPNTRTMDEDEQRLAGECMWTPTSIPEDDCAAYFDCTLMAQELIASEDPPLRDSAVLRPTTQATRIEAVMAHLKQYGYNIGEALGHVTNLSVGADLTPWTRQERFLFEIGVAEGMSLPNIRDKLRTKHLSEVVHRYYHRKLSTATQLNNDDTNEEDIQADNNGKVNEEKEVEEGIQANNNNNNNNNRVEDEDEEDEKPANASDSDHSGEPARANGAAGERDVRMIVKDEGSEEELSAHCPAAHQNTQTNEHNNNSLENPATFSETESDDSTPIASLLRTSNDKS